MYIYFLKEICCSITYHDLISKCTNITADSRLTSIDIQNFIEMGLHIVRFKMTHITHKDKIRLLEMIKNAVKWCCEKYEVSHWPIAISIDIPSCVIKTGMIKQVSDCIYFTILIFIGLLNGYFSVSGNK